jgi:hypothetical protein
MFRRNLILVWVGIIVLSSVYLMGQDTWPPQNDPCDPDPCATIEYAIAGTCTAIDATDFTCNCDTGYTWTDPTNTCMTQFFLTPLPKTGQTTTYGTRDDGDLEMGVAWPDPRFTNNGNGTVTDNLTDLIWTLDADCDGNTKSWVVALDYCNTLTTAYCGLSDGSSAGDWRLANRWEMESLLDLENSGPALPTGHPFTDVASRVWSSTTYADVTSRAWYMDFSTGQVYNGLKTGSNYVRCVKGGQ